MNDFRACKLYNDSLARLNGQGVKQNDQLAFSLNLESAELGFADAILAMGWYYLNGVGVDSSVDQATYWYKKSARHGSTQAMFSLGQIAFDSQKWSDAKMWFQRAADKQHHRSLFWLGKHYWRGHGVELNKKMAKQLFHHATKKKVKEAQRAIRMLP